MKTLPANPRRSVRIEIVWSDEAPAIQGAELFGVDGQDALWKSICTGLGFQFGKSLIGLASLHEKDSESGQEGRRNSHFANNAAAFALVGADLHRLRTRHGLQLQRELAHVLYMIHHMCRGGGSRNNKFA